MEYFPVQTSIVFEDCGVPVGAVLESIVASEHCLKKFSLELEPR